MTLLDFAPARKKHTLVDRAPAGVKLACAALIIGITVMLPVRSTWWLVCCSTFVAGVTFASGVPVLFIAKRLLLLTPFVFGVTLVNAFHPALRHEWPWLIARSGLCLLTLVVLANTTPFSQLLKVLSKLRVPALLITTIALMHRYIFVLVEEAQRMRTARASRTFRPRRKVEWQGLAGVASQLFIRALERSERIYAAMCARGMK